MGVQGAKSPAGVWGTLPGGQVIPRNLFSTQVFCVVQ